MIELVVSIAVLSLVILPFFGIFTSAARLDERSRNDLTANYLAQKLAEEAKSHPLVHEGWTRTVSAGSVAFERQSLDNPFNGYSARILYAPLTLSVAPNGFEEFVAGGTNGYDAVFELTWDENAKTLSYSFGGSAPHTVNATDTSNNIDITLDNHEGMDAFLFEVKINRNNPLLEYPFTLDSSIDSIRIKVALDQESTVVQSNRTVTVTNNTRDWNLVSRAISLEVDAVNFQADERVDIRPGNADADILFKTLEAGGDPSGPDTSCCQLTIEITGYDPISQSNKVLKILKTTACGRE